MTDKLPELIGRRFIVSFLLPILAFAMALLFRMSGFQGLKDAWNLIREDGSSALAMAAVLWLSAVVLSTTNRATVRFLEGYGAVNPLRFFLPVELRRFRRLRSEQDAITSRIADLENAGKQVPNDLAKREIRVYRELADRFPDSEEWLLPTSLGNTIRAFETYPRVLYGLEGIDGWNRLSAVIPSDYRDSINDAQSEMNFWVSISLLSLLFLLVHGCLVTLSEETVLSGRQEWESIGISVAALLTSFIAYRRVVSSALAWGRWVRSAFDVFLNDLGNKVGVADIALEFQQQGWQLLSQAIIYRDRRGIERLEALRTQHDSGLHGHSNHLPTGVV